MFNSKEIRWFNQTENKDISKWFNSKGLFFAATVPRRDFYLPLPNKEDMGIKLREGKVEVKYRIGKPKVGKLTGDTEGFYENWEKWSFGVKEGDGLSKIIIQDKNYEWIEVYKERIGVKFTKNESGKTDLLNIKEFISYGCQVEYTRILIRDQEWFSFGLEWFGEKYIDLDTSLTSEILGNAILKKEDSMGYARFLNLNFN